MSAQKSGMMIMTFVCVILAAGAVFSFVRIQSLESSLGDIASTLNDIKDRPAETKEVVSEKPADTVNVTTGLTDEDRAALRNDIVDALRGEIAAEVASAIDQMKENGELAAGGGDPSTDEGRQQLKDEIRKEMTQDLTKRAMQFGQGMMKNFQGEMSNTLEQELELLPAQKEQVDEILKAQMNKAMAILPTMGQMSREERQKAFQDLMSDTDDQMKGVLNANQLQKWDELKQNGMGGGGFPWGGGRRGGGGQQDGPRGF